MTSSPADASANATSAAKDVTDAKPGFGIGEWTIPMAAKRAGALWSKIGKNRQNSNPIIHCPTSEGVSEMSERANE